MKLKIRRKLKKTAVLAKNLDGIEMYEGENSEREDNVESKTLLIGNGGLENGVSSHHIYNIFHQYGSIHQIFSHPKRPYCLLKFENRISALNAQTATNGIRFQIEGREMIFYVGLVKCEGAAPNWEINPVGKVEGLLQVDDFINGEEENVLTAITMDKIDKMEYQTLQNRKVIHFGYFFDYSVNAAAKDQSVDEIPALCQSLMLRAMHLGYISQLPDQLTVNIYEPGDGIPAHVDDPSNFGPEIICLGILSAALMEFKSVGCDGSLYEVDLKPRGLVVMRGDSRNEYTHRISSRKVDFVRKHDECLHVRKRQTRISFTFRKTSNGFANHLSSYSNAIMLEKTHVKDTYEKIAQSFSKTRTKAWPVVRGFLDSLETGSLLLEVGCGNGKNMIERRELITFGCDICESFCNLVTSEQGLETCVADCLELPFRNQCFDAVMSIAVIHHLSTIERRKDAIREIIRMLRPGGARSLISVWAFEQEYESKSGPSAEHQCPEGSGLLIHKNRTQFKHQDVLVPWKSDGYCLNRFYHVFKKGELSDLVASEGVTIEKEETYEKGNWFIIIRKK